MTNPRSERRNLLSRFLQLQGVAYMAIGLTWLVTETRGRLAGINWLEHALAWVPGDLSLDTKAGIGWLLVGALLITSGCLSKRWSKMEDVGFTALVVWPLFMSVVFFMAWAMGAHGSGWVNSVSYIAFLVFPVAYLLPHKGKEVSVNTSGLELGEVARVLSSTTSN